MSSKQEALWWVHTGETASCEWIVESETQTADRYRLENDVVYRTESGTPVIEASTGGLLWKRRRP